MRRLTLKISSAVVLLALVFAIVGGVFAQTKTVNWQRYDVDITVQTNGDLRVVETQEIQFVGGTFTSGFATIPLNHTDGITDVKLSEPNRHIYLQDNGGPYSYTVSTDSSNVTIDWTFPPLADEIRTFVLEYTVHGAVRQYTSGDKLQYLAITRELEFPVFKSIITVHLPPGGPLIADPDSAGAPMGYNTAADSLGVTYYNTGVIQPYEGVELGLVFQHGAVTGPKPSWQDDYDRQTTYEDRVKPMIDLGLGALALGLLVAVPGGLYLMWYLFGRDPAAGLVPQYITDPPSNLPPGLAGTLIDERADLRDITATLIDLARRGFATLEAHESTTVFGTASRSYVLKKANPSAKLRGYEQMIYDAVFGGLNERALNKMPDTFFNKLGNIELAMYDEGVKEGLFKSNPAAVRTSYQALGGFTMFFSVVVGFIAAVATSGLSGSIACLFVPFFLFGLGLMAMSGSMPVKSRKGATEAAKWRAFQKYLGNIQQYRDVAGATDQFEKFLPYAIAFGLEQRWVNAFAKAPNLVVPAPIWYRPIYMGNVPGGVSGGRAAVPGAPGAPLPNLNDMGSGMVGGLNQIGEGLIGALNTAGRSFASPPTPKYTYSGGGSRGFSGGGGFRSSGGGSFRGGGFSGGGSRGFR